MPVNPPDRLQLLDAVLGTLESDPQAASGVAAYEARIAISLLRILRRELEAGDALLAGERARLTTLVGQDGDASALNARLCELIRRRQIDIADERLLSHLRTTVLAKLAIDNPRYSAYRRATEQAGAAGG